MPDDNSSVASVTAPVGQGPLTDVAGPVNQAPVDGVPAPDSGVGTPIADEPVLDNGTGAPVADTSTVDNPVVVEPVLPDASTDEGDINVESDIPTEVVRRIGEAHNVLIALSSDPSVDEMAAAIGLSLFLDKLGKRATAIYSGATPNALEFLKPEETFESTADALQDFVIALNKDKADHLRYKLDGDFVKIYITPYKARISEEDLEYSYGDFNVDLVLALDVANGVDLDSALREHGRIMHDATIVNITTGNPGKFGEIEWSDKKASSVSEMIAKLLYSVNGATIEKEEATAFLTGIVAATNRFSNAGTTSETMKLSSRLMESGANQQLISKNITPDVENEMINMLSMDKKASKNDNDPTKLDVEHGNEEGVDESKEVDTTVTEKSSTLLDDLKAAEASLAQAGDETVPETANEPLKIDDAQGNNEELPKLEVPEGIEEEAAAMASGNVVEPPVNMNPNTFAENNDSNYGQMLENALSNTEPVEPIAPIMSPNENPAAVNTPDVPTTPEINGVPEINYMPMPGDEILPPPPAPMSLGPQPAMQDQVYNPQAVDPNAFKIPGM